MPYVDYNSTTPLRPEALEAMRTAFLEDYGNPASTHDAGMKASYLIEKARESMARSLGCEADELYFTSGGTESNWLALTGLAEIAREQGRPMCVTAAIEHACVLVTLDGLVGQPLMAVERIGAKANGRVDEAKFVAAMGERTGLAALMLANNETGVLQPVKEMATEAHKRGLLFHCDAVQAVGKVPVNLRELGLDTAAISAHKFGGPKGVGALYVRGGLGRLKLKPRMSGGNQESGLRPGTHNTPGIVGMARALELAVSEMGAETTRLGSLREKLRLGLLAALPAAEVNGDLTQAVPNTLNIWLKGKPATEMVRLLSSKGVFASAGAACSAANVLEPSHVLIGMGLGPERAGQSLRFSLGHGTTEADIETATSAVRDCVGGNDRA